MENFFQVNIGQLAVVVSILLSGVFFVRDIKSDVARQAEMLKGVEIELVKLREVVVALARQEERLTAMDQRMLLQGLRIDKLQNGK